MWLVLVLRFIILYKHAELRKHLSNSCLMALSNSLGYLRCLEPLHVHAIITLTESFPDVEQLQPYHRIERIYMCILSRPRSLPEVFCLLVHGKLIRLNAIKSPERFKFMSLSRTKGITWLNNEDATTQNLLYLSYFFNQ